MRHLIPVSGKDSLATAIVQITRDPSPDYELFFNDVGTELPETYEWLGRVERKLGSRITRVGKSLEDIIRGQGMLPSAQVRFCTRMGKIEPMEEYLGDEPTTVYFGIRADEDRAGYHGKKSIVPKYPLKELGINLEMVYSIVDSQKLRPPTFFWNRLHDRVCEQWDRERNARFTPLPTAEESISVMPVWFRDALFAWRTRPNCYFCFFQRKYELVGLLEHHPDLFDRAEKIEREVGDDRQREKFYWLRDCPLPLVRRERERIFNKRVRQVIGLMKQKRSTRDPEDVLSLTSCGLFCGK